MMENRGGPRPAAFLDRDGTIIVEREYLADPDGVALLPGAAAALRELQALGFALVLVTNQSGIARGYYSVEQYQAVQDRLEALLGEHDVRFDAVRYCPHHPNVTGPCDCRKPGLALFTEVAETLHLDVRRSVWIGDRLSDVEPAARLGGTAYLVRTGYGHDQEARAGTAVAVRDDLAGVVASIRQTEQAG